jgi:hypothetical protein
MKLNKNLLLTSIFFQDNDFYFRGRSKLEFACFILLEQWILSD